MSNVDFIENFVQNCIAKGKNTPTLLQEEGNNEVTRLDQEMRATVKESSTKIAALKDMIRQMGGNSVGKRLQFNYYAVYQSLSPKHQEMVKTLMSLFKKQTSATTSQILDSIGYGENKIVLETLMWMHYKKIIARNEETHAYQAGELWFKGEELCTDSVKIVD